MTVSRQLLITLAGIIAALALVAAGLGVFWQGEGQPFAFVTLRGETVMIQGRGLYYYDSVSGAAQEIAQDVVTLLVGLPLLLLSMWLFRRGGLRGQLLFTGTLGYFLYTYAMMSFQTAYNPLFLVYVALFSLSLFTFVMAMGTIRVAELPGQFAESLPRRSVAGFLFVIGGFLSLAWLGRIAQGFGGRPPVGLEAYNTLVIQVLDLGLIVPLSVLAGALLWRRSAWGYLLAAIILVKGFTLSIAVSAMVAGQLLAGITVSPVEAAVFPALSLAGAAMLALLLRAIRPAAGGGAAAPSLP